MYIMYYGSSLLLCTIPEEPLVTVKKDTNQFVIAHCQRTMPVLYNVSGWLRRAREHPSYRIVAQVLSESKRYVCVRVRVCMSMSVSLSVCIHQCCFSLLKLKHFNLDNFLLVC